MMYRMRELPVLENANRKKSTDSIISQLIKAKIQIYFKGTNHANELFNSLYPFES